MIYDLALAVADRLQAKKYSVAVVYGPDQLTPGNYDSRIVIERDRDSTDELAAPTGGGRNPPKIATRYVNATATIWAKSNLDGARVGDHERLCEQFVDAVTAAVHVLVSARQHRAPTFTESRMLKTPPAGVTPSVWPGVVYVIRWRVPRGVYDVDFNGDGLPTGSPTATSNSVEIRRNASDPPETVET